MHQDVFVSKVHTATALFLYAHKTKTKTKGKDEEISKTVSDFQKKKKHQSK